MDTVIDSISIPQWAAKVNQRANRALGRLCPRAISDRPYYIPPTSLTPREALDCAGISGRPLAAPTAYNRTSLRPPIPSSVHGLLGDADSSPLARNDRGKTKASLPHIRHGLRRATYLIAVCLPPAGTNIATFATLCSTPQGEGLGNVGACIARPRGLRILRRVEAKDTPLYFPQGENAACVFASPLPHKGLRLCGVPGCSLRMTEESSGRNGIFWIAAY